MYISMSHCPGIQQSAPISALIKMIGLCGTQNAQNIFGPDQQFLTPYRTEVCMADLLYELVLGAYRPG